MPEDFTLMSRFLKFDEYNQDELIHDDMEEMSKFYIILRGKITTFKRNPDIHNWEWAKDLQESLKNWKKSEFDVKVKKQMHLHLIQDTLHTDTK